MSNFREESYQAIRELVPDVSPMTPQQKFLNDEVLMLTIKGAFERSRVYRSTSVGDEYRVPFREFIREALTNVVDTEYTSLVSDEQHTASLLLMKANIDNEFRDILRGGEITLGIVQKLLNLNLKYRWTLGDIPTPPHCPFDSIIINQLPECRGISWTQLNSVTEYDHLVAMARRVAGAMPLSEWELRAFNRR